MYQTLGIESQMNAIDPSSEGKMNAPDPGSNSQWMHKTLTQKAEWIHQTLSPYNNYKNWLFMESCIKCHFSGFLVLVNCTVMLSAVQMCTVQVLQLYSEAGVSTLQWSKAVCITPLYSFKLCVNKI